MTVPPMCTELTFDEISSELVAIYQTYDTEYVANESDEVMPVLETVAYRELQLRTYVNDLVRQSFWQTATGDYLDFHASEFFITRDAGAKPTASVTFTLNTTLSTEYVLTAGLELLNEDGSTSLLLADVTFSVGSTEATGIAELQLYTATSDTKVISTMVPKAYLSSIVQTTVYSGGSNPMGDDALRALIALANEQQTTAGSIKSYKYWALQSDARITDVNVYRKTSGEVEVVVHSLTGVDATMLERVQSATSESIHRPLTDTVNVYAATQNTYSVVAVLTISDSADATSTLASAKARLIERLNAVNIGKSVTLGMIISALSVDGVEDVTVTTPSATVGAGDDEVAVLTTVEVSVG
jgi:phage-related baseplate assembly protein